MRAHNSSPGRNSAIQQYLHRLFLVATLRKTNAVTLPIATRPLRFYRGDQSRYVRKQAGIAARQFAAAGDNAGQLLQLFAAYGRLDVCHAVIESKLRVSLKDDLIGRVPHGIGHRHGMLAPQSELLIPVLVPGCDHAAVSGRHQFSRMERETSRVAVRLSDPLPSSIPKNFAAGGAGRILNQRQTMALGNRLQLGHVAWHADLMDTKDRSRAAGDRRLDEIWVHVESCRVDVYKDRNAAAIANAIRGGDIRVTDRYNLVASPHTGREQRQVERGRAIRNSTCVRSRDCFGEFSLERSYLGPLRNPTGQNDTAGGLSFALVERRFDDRDHESVSTRL